LRESLFQERLTQWRRHIQNIINEKGVSAACLAIGYNIAKTFDSIRKLTKELVEVLSRPTTTVMAHEFYNELIWRTYCSPLLYELYNARCLMVLSDEFCGSCFGQGLLSDIDRMIDIIENYGLRVLREDTFLRNELDKLSEYLSNRAPPILTCR